MPKRFLLVGLALACGASAHGADDTDVLARWAYGAGTIAGHASKDAAQIAKDDVVEAATDTPVRLELNGFSFGQIVLGAGAKVTLGVEGTEDRRLVLALGQGVMQVDVDGTGPYQHIVVRGGASEIIVTGTSFLFERVNTNPEHAIDYVAVIKGNLKVGLQQALSERLPDESPIELQSRQGLFVYGSLPDFAFSSIDQLSMRPHLPLSADAQPGSLYQQGLQQPTEGDGDWDIDLASKATKGGRANSIPEEAPKPNDKTSTAEPKPEPEKPVEAREPPKPVLSRNEGPKFKRSHRQAVMDELTDTVRTGSPLGEPLRAP